jgi:antirestriction protein ArdC
MSTIGVCWEGMASSERTGASDHQSRHPQAPSPVLQAALTRLEQAVTGIQDSDAFRAYLDVQARFHRYSFSNALLILSQSPDATQVAGFQTWKQLGRPVRKGEHGIKILVPYRSTRARTEQVEPADPRPEGAPAVQVDAANDAIGHHHLTGARRFGVGTVFDISQTDGPPLPTIDVPVLAGDEGQTLYDQLAGVAVANGLTLQHQNDRLGPATMGSYSPSERLIVVREASTRQMTKTLAHELAHYFSGATAASPEEETVAESAAYVVCARFGLDTGERSFPYVATWSQDQRVFRAALGRIQQVSHRLIERVETRAEISFPAIGHPERSHDLS